MRPLLFARECRTTMLPVSVKRPPSDEYETKNKSSTTSTFIKFNIFWVLIAASDWKGCSQLRATCCRTAFPTILAVKSRASIEFNRRQDRTRVTSAGAALFTGNYADYAGRSGDSCHFCHLAEISKRYKAMCMTMYGIGNTIRRTPARPHPTARRHKTSVKIDVRAPSGGAYAKLASKSTSMPDWASWCAWRERIGFPLATAL
ncbi:hypothetical protein C8R48DRAFT_694408 [Suillus tomentosus]|nr:hypothetical protein C8R48DRAFT_694408 [Suillus tomentosus]